MAATVSVKKMGFRQIGRHLCFPLPTCSFHGSQSTAQRSKGMPRLLLEEQPLLLNVDISLFLNNWCHNVVNSLIHCMQTFSFDIGLDLCPKARSGGISGEKAVHSRLDARIAGNNLEIRTTS